MHRLTRGSGMTVAMVLLACASARGADPATQPDTTQPATRPASQPTTGPLKISLNFKDVPLDAVLNFLSQTLGFEILKDGPVEGRVTLLSRQPVSAAEAVTMLNAALKINGFTVVREGQLLRINARDKAKKGNLPVHFGAKPADVAETDELITQVIPVQNVSAVKLRDDLKPLIGPDADVTANDGSNTIIITDTSASIRRLVEIIARLDESEAQTSELRVVQLKHAGAAATAKLIDSLFKVAAGMPQQPQQGQPQPGGPGGRGGGAPAGGGGSERHGASVITAADERTNTLLVMASTSTLKLIDKVIEQLDSDNPNPVPPSEMRAFPLKFAAADATARIVNNVFKAGGGRSGSDEYPFYMMRYGGGGETASKEAAVNAVADERTNTLIVTAPTARLKEVEGLIRQLDASPMVAADLRVIHLKYAEAGTVSLLVQDMFKPKESDGGSRFPFFIFSSAPQQQQASGVKVNVTADGRTNSLLVSAPTELLEVIERVVRELDSDPTAEDTLFIYHLRNSQAARLEYVLNVLFGNINSPNQGQQNNQQQNQQNPQEQQGGARGGLGESNALGGRGNRDNPINRSASGRNQPGGRGGMPPAVAQAITELTGKVFVVADPDTNALLVTTASKYQKQVRKIIEILDQSVPQVLIKVLIAEVTHDNSDDLGWDFSILNTRSSGQGQRIGTAFGNAAAQTVNGGLVVSLLESQVQATLHALSTSGKLDVLSRPYILASDNQLASITVGQIVPFVTESRIDQNSNTINTVQYQDIGIILNVTPHINPDGLVILDVNPQISALTDTNIQLSPGVSSPVFQKRSADSRVAIVNGQTIVIGGLMQDQKTSTLRKVPILGDIPLLGLLFQRNQVKKTKTELLIFLTPHVAQQPDTLLPMSLEESRGTRLTPSAVTPGTFQDHMQGMKRGGGSPQTRPSQPISPVDSIELNDPNPTTKPTTKPTNRSEVP